MSYMLVVYRLYGKVVHYDIYSKSQRFELDKPIYKVIKTSGKNDETKAPIFIYHLVDKGQENGDHFLNSDDFFKQCRKVHTEYTRRKKNE